MRRSILLASILITLFAYSVEHQSSTKTTSQPSGSFHISQYINSSWVELYDEPFSVQYQTKIFPLQRTDDQVIIEIVQKSVSYGDIEFVQLYACGQVLPPLTATYLQDNENLVDNLTHDDHNVVTNHEKPIRVSWKLPHLCPDTPVLILKANEYESPEENAFRFPAQGTPFKQYIFKNNGSLHIDGRLTEVDELEKPDFSPFWLSSTGHPSNNTHIYVRDDKSYVYFGVDILLDNTDDYGHDWLKIIAYNHTSGKTHEYRVDDYTDTFGTCAFGLTSKVTHKHQSCEIRIPKNEIMGTTLDYSLGYYGTSGGGEPTMSITSVAYATIIPDRTPSITGNAVAVDGASPATSVQFGLADSHGATEGNTVLNYEGTCTATDGAFDETTEPFTCTTSTLGYGDYKMFIQATNGSQSATNSSAQFTVFNSLFDEQINEDGFGNALNIETSTLLVVDSILYAGTVQEGGTGAELWSYNGSAWTQETSLGDPTITKIDTLVSFNNAIYATIVSGIPSLEVWKYENDVWTEINTASLSSPTAYTDERSPAVVYNNALYVGTTNSSTFRAEIWKYNGSSWTLVNTPGFGDADNLYVHSLKVHNSLLYAGISNATNGTEVWEYNDSSWQQVNADGFGNGFNLATESLESYNGVLYAGTYNANDGTEVYSYSGTGTSWTLTNTSGFGDTQNQNTESLYVFNGNLYAGISSVNGNEIWEFNGSSWTNPGIRGFRSTSHNRTISALQGYKGILYAGGRNTIVGSEVWAGTNDIVAPSLTLTAITDPTSDTTPVLVGTAVDAAGATITAVQFQVDSTSGSWSTCTADDGTYDESSESFTCSVLIELSAGSHTIYARSTDSNSNTTSNDNVSTDTFVISSSSSTPSPTPTPTPAPLQSSPEQPQIPQGQSEAIGGEFKPVKDSYTHGQDVTVIIEPGTLNNDAYISAQATLPTSENGILQSPLMPVLPPSSSIIPTNTVQAGEFLGIKQACGIAWQVGNIQQLWYKTYPPQGTNVAPAIIIPQLQKRPSIISLKYTAENLIPPGQPRSRFQARSLKLAHSLDGHTWKTMPTSVIDTQTNTVAALDKVGGFYMIVSGCQGGYVQGSSLGATTSPLKVAPSMTNQDLPLPSKKVQPRPTEVTTPVKNVTPTKSNQDQSLLQRISSFLQSVL